MVEWEGRRAGIADKTNLTKKRKHMRLPFALQTPLIHSSDGSLYVLLFPTANQPFIARMTAEKNPTLMLTIATHPHCPLPLPQ